MTPTCGIFVGGRGARMGGVAKGLLSFEGEPIVSRTARFARAAGLDVVLVGDASAYGGLGLPAIADDPQGVGPLGGLHALLGNGDAVVVGCDMPYLRLEDFVELVRFAPEAEVVAPRFGDDAPWEALFSRWSHRTRAPVKSALDAGVRSFQRLLQRFEVRRISLVQAALADWDEPSDIPAERAPGVAAQAPRARDR